jgi:hypothetical protein
MLSVAPNFGCMVKVKNAINVGVDCENDLVRCEWPLQERPSGFRFKDVVRHQQQEIVLDFISGLQRRDTIGFVIIRIFRRISLRPNSELV